MLDGSSAAALFSCTCSDQQKTAYSQWRSLNLSNHHRCQWLQATVLEAQLIFTFLVDETGKISPVINVDDSYYFTQLNYFSPK